MSRLMHARMCGWMGLALGVMAAGVPATHAQTTVEQFERRLEQIRRETRIDIDPDVPIGQRLFVDYGVYLSFNFFAIDDPGQSTHLLRQYDANAYLRVNIDGAHEFFGRVRSSYRDWNSGDSFEGTGDDWVEPTLERGWYKFDLNRALVASGSEPLAGNATVKIGRQLVHWANGLALSLDLDGVTAAAWNDDVRIDGVLGMTRNSVTDFDSSRPGFNNDTERLFGGAMVSLTVVPDHTPFVYLLIQRDFNDDEIRIDGPLTTTFEYESYYLGFGANGRIGDDLAYRVEAALETGSSRSRNFDRNLVVTPQRDDDIFAFAIDAQLDYLLLDQNRTRFTAQALFASGDSDRLNTSGTVLGNTPGTTDNAFNAFGLIDTGLAFAPAVSNIFMLRGGASTFPLPQHPWFSRLQIGINLFAFFKADAAAPIEEATTSNAFLGVEPDIFVNWQVTSDVSVALRYGVFFPGSAIVQDDDPRHFFFSGVTIGF